MTRMQWQRAEDRSTEIRAPANNAPPINLWGRPVTFGPRTMRAKLAAAQAYADAHDTRRADKALKRFSWEDK